MGYDMYIEQGEGLKGDDGYFRLNIFGMQEWRGYMQQLGMLDYYAEQGEWPEPSELVKDAIYKKMPEDYTPEEAQAVEEYEAAQRVVTEAETGGVLPGFKFCSNDGWLVTPDEIHRSLEAYKQTSKERRMEVIALDDWDYWSDWIRFLRRAEKRGGFRVW